MFWSKINKMLKKRDAYDFKICFTNQAWPQFYEKWKHAHTCFCMQILLFAFEFLLNTVQWDFNHMFIKKLIKLQMSGPSKHYIYYVKYYI